VGSNARPAENPVKAALYTALVILYLLHNDLWLWYDECLIEGIPSGLLYHIFFCFAVSILMALLVRFAWPHLETD
jgi:hypothetical protein